MTPVPAWEAFADAVLQRDALILRIGDGIPPNDYAGMAVDHEELERIARSLPGLNGPDLGDVADLRAVLDPVVQERRRALMDEVDDASAFSQLCARADLSVDEAELLAVALAVEIDRRRQRLLIYVQDDVRLSRLTLGTVDRLFDERGRVGKLGPGSALVRSGLVEVENEGPWALRQLWTPSRLVWSLIGHDAADPGLPAAARVEGPSVTKAAEGAVLLVHGADPLTRLDAVGDRWPDTGFIVSPPPGDEKGWRAVVREATVGGRVVVVELEKGLSVDARRWIESAIHLRWVLSSSAELPVETLPQRPWTEVTAEYRPAADDDWLHWVGRARNGAPPLSRTQLRLVHHIGGADGDGLSAAVRRLAGGHLDSLARRIRPRRGWSDLVLPDDQLAQLRELAARYRWRARVHEDWGFPALPSSGVVALFAGPSGTGKTLAAEVIAADLGLDLYKVDLSAVVSKYIGETEKNLERIFSAAAAGELVLFFDEADALFGKRSEVSDAHDRYANIEVAYLLQRLESYDGLVVLATNLSRNIDDAFLRRISVGVEFPMPGEDERRAIWRTSLPDRAPVSDLDYEFLAGQFKVSGGVIRNALLGAAFLAADADCPITMETVIRAVVREFQKTGRLRIDADFEHYVDAVNGGQDSR